MSTYTEFVIFLADYNRYRVDIFRVCYTFNGLSNGISHFLVAQNFIISTCLSMSTWCECFSETVFSFKTKGQISDFRD